MVNLKLISYKANNLLVLIYTLVLLSLFLNFFRINILDKVFFFPVILMYFFIFSYLLFFVDNMKQIFIKKNNIIYLIFFFFYLFINFILFNEEFSNLTTYFRLFLNDFIKYFSYYIFFCILGPRIIINNELIFFKILVVFAVSIIAFGLFMISYHELIGADLIPRVFYYNDASVVGQRFYSLFGEPRDAAVGITIIIIMVLTLYKNFDVTIKAQYFKYVFIFLVLSIIALLYTKSATLLLLFILSSVFIPSILIVKYYKKIDTKFLTTLFIIILLFSSVIFISTNYIQRLNTYYLDFIELFKFIFYFKGDLNFSDYAGQFSGTNVNAQVKDIFPIIKFLKQTINLNYLNILFGNGTYASFTVTNGDFIHPHSNIARFLYDNGLVGLSILTAFFYSALPTKKTFHDYIILAMTMAAFLSLNSIFWFAILLINLQTHVKNK
jgi:hypothetical protein